jgi:hypothetical protein
MKAVKLSLVIMATALLAIGLSGMAYAFHSGGVAECEGCHSMHAPKAGGSHLLVGSDPSSTCLTCHEHAGDTGPSSYHISTADADLGAGIAPLQRTPGGDFGWIKKSYTITYTSGGETVTETEEGQTHGHNVVALDNNYFADTENTVAPGGSYLASDLGCSSCHDPHGQGRRLSDGSYATTGAPIIGSGSYGAVPGAGEAVGIYRLLGSPAYDAMDDIFTTFPIAIAPSSYNRSEATTQTRVAYGATGTNTWGNWCASCHPGMHSSGNYVHPVDQSLGSEIATGYSNYVKSGDLSGNFTGSSENQGPFLSLAPFAENTGDFALLASHANSDGSYLNGPGTSDKVVCLSCHRAHASGFLHGLRFDIGYEFMVKGGDYIGSDNPAITGSRAPLQHRGRTIAEWQAAYYDRPATVFATYQRVLCNKCHAKD